MSHAHVSTGLGKDANYSTRVLLDIPVQYASMVGLAYDPDDPLAYAASGKKINILIPGLGYQANAKGERKAKDLAARKLVKYGIPYQAAKGLVDKSFEILDPEDYHDSFGREVKNYPGLRLEDLSPEDIAAGRGRTGMLTGVDDRGAALKTGVSSEEKISTGDPFGSTKRASAIGEGGESISNCASSLS